MGTLELDGGALGTTFLRVASADLGRTWKEKGLSQASKRPLDGLLVLRSGTKLAETTVRGDVRADEWDLVFRRQR